VPIDEALIDAGRRRFRPVLLTTLTTVAGLLPILLETSFQAQVLIPMANSLSFGLLLATGLILILVPSSYRIYYSWFPPYANPEDDLSAESVSESLVSREEDSAHSSENVPVHVSLKPIE
jgi:predicted RND superfamily exporter protein